jgi:hypothetical protein
MKSIPILKNYSDNELNKLAKLIYERCFARQLLVAREKIKLLTETLAIPSEKYRWIS